MRNGDGFHLAKLPVLQLFVKITLSESKEGLSK